MGSGNFEIMAVLENAGPVPPKEHQVSSCDRKEVPFIKEIFLSPQVLTRATGPAGKTPLTCTGLYLSFRITVGN